MKKLVLFFLRASVCLFIASTASRAATVNVTIGGFAFTPQNVTIQVGDTVTWINTDGTFHTTTSGQAGVPDGQ